MNRSEVLDRGLTLMDAALAYYAKPKCFLIVDRDGQGYEVAISKLNGAYTDEACEAGMKLFGRLKMTSTLCAELVP